MRTFGISIKTFSAVAILMASMAVAFWWWSAGNTPEVSAQDSVEDACAKIDNSGYYHIAVKSTWSGLDDSLLTNIKVAGDDMEITLTLGGESGPFSQFRRVGGVDYESDGTTWVRLDAKFDDLSVLYASLNLPCPTTAEFQKVGTETLDGKSTTRYTETAESINKRAPSEDFVGVSQTPRSVDIWIDEDGKVVQHHQVIDEKDNFRSQGNPSRSVLTIHSVFADVGRANTVTAPDVG